MRPGEIWTVAGGGDYLRKPRPAVVVYSDSRPGVESVTVCPLTTDPRELPVIRIPVVPDELNGLNSPSWIMVDRITTVRQSRLGDMIGRLSAADWVRLVRSIGALADHGLGG